MAGGWLRDDSLGTWKAAKVPSNNRGGGRWLLYDLHMRNPPLPEIRADAPPRLSFEVKAVAGAMLAATALLLGSAVWQAIFG